VEDVTDHILPPDHGLEIDHTLVIEIVIIIDIDAEAPAVAPPGVGEGMRIHDGGVCLAIVMTTIIEEAPRQIREEVTADGLLVPFREIRMIDDVQQSMNIDPLIRPDSGLAWMMWIMFAIKAVLSTIGISHPVPLPLERPLNHQMTKNEVGLGTVLQDHDETVHQVVRKVSLIDGDFQITIEVDDEIEATILLPQVLEEDECPL